MECMELKLWMAKAPKTHLCVEGGGHGQNQWFGYQGHFMASETAPTRATCQDNRGHGPSSQGRCRMNQCRVKQGKWFWLLVAKEHEPPWEVKDESRPQTKNQLHPTLVWLHLQPCMKHIVMQNGLEHKDFHPPPSGFTNTTPGFTSAIYEFQALYHF